MPKHTASLSLKPGLSLVSYTDQIFTIKQCDVDATHCDPATCLQQFSGDGSSCAVCI